MWQLFSFCLIGLTYWFDKSGDFFSPLFSLFVLCNDSLRSLSLLLLKLMLTFNSLISCLKALFSLSIDKMGQFKEWLITNISNRLGSSSLGVCLYDLQGFHLSWPPCLISLKQKFLLLQFLFGQAFHLFRHLCEIHL